MPFAILLVEPPTGTVPLLLWVVFHRLLRRGYLIVLPSSHLWEPVCIISYMCVCVCVCVCVCENTGLEDLGLSPGFSP
jgi:hypothetical protein